MSEKSNSGGGAAFPSCGADGQGPHGMTLRDYFAANAMAAIIQSSHTESESVGMAAKRLGIEPSAYHYSIHWPKICSLDAYTMADAMLAARERAK